MSGAAPAPADDARLAERRAQLDAYLRLALLITASLSLVYLGGALMTKSGPLAGSAAVAAAVFALHVVARRAARRDELSDAAGLSAYSIVAASAVGAFVLPTAFAGLLFMPGLAAAAALPYLEGAQLRRVFTATALAAVSIAWFGMFGPWASTLPPPIARDLTLATAAMGSALMLYLLWQFAERLRKNLAAAEALAADRADQQRWLQALLDLVPVPMLLVEPATARVTFANAAGARLASGPGASAEQALRDLARPWMLDAEGKPAPPEAQAPSRAARGERLLGVEMNVRGADGELRTYLVSTETLPASYGNPSVAVIALSEVTTLKKALRARDDFLNVASHELRTPLAALQLSVSAIALAHKRGQGPLPPEQETRLTVAQRQVGQLNALVGNLLDVSQFTSGRLTLDRTETDLGDVAREIAERLRGHAGADALTLECAPAVGRWDRLRIERVVTNLLSNALKYGLGKPVRVTVSADAGRARLVVADRGIGISPEAQAKLFGRFERAVTQREFDGIGLGLWIVRQVTEAHGGTVQVVSALGEGATFTVELPA